MKLSVAPADFDTFSAAMGPRGGSGGCWCMLWRVPAKTHAAQEGEGNREAMRERFIRGPRPPGLVATVGDDVAGWIQVDERSAFPRLATSRVLKPVDDLPVWSVACFLVKKPYRGRGVALALLEGACRFAEQHGAPALEGYPVEPEGRYTPTFAWTGFYGTFRDAGFTEVARRSPTRPIMRMALAT